MVNTWTSFTTVEADAAGAMKYNMKVMHHGLSEAHLCLQHGKVSIQIIMEDH